jgi:DNA-binding PadR family transcriptional regulator
MDQVAELEPCDFWNLSRSRVHRELSNLAQNGLIDAGEKGVRAKVPYTINDVGRVAFRAWLNEDPPLDIIRSPFHLICSGITYREQALAWLNGLPWGRGSARPGITCCTHHATQLR